MALAVARDIGVTRLADITGLDRIGIPVWQAVRPWGRSLSLHQGKGLDADDARLGACMEAIECGHAEAWTGASITARFDDLPAAERAACAGDFADVRNGCKNDVSLAWTLLERIGGGHLWVPVAVVSLDLTVAGPAGVERGSNGQGAGFDLSFASFKGLCELIERDAVAAWQCKTVVSRVFDAIDCGSIGFDWFITLAGRLAGLGIAVRAYRVPAVIDMPVVAVELREFAGEAAGHPHTAGTCAHADAEAALKGALIEAIQARLTGIAGAREDIKLGAPEARPPTLGLALAPPLNVAAHGFAALFPAVASATPLQAFDAAIASLAAAGYPIVARALLSPSGCPVTTVKMFAPGLGALRRTRRAAAS